MKLPLSSSKRYLTSILVEWGCYERVTNETTGKKEVCLSTNEFIDKA